MILPEILAKHQICVVCPKCGTLIEGWTWDDLFECPLCGTRTDHINFEAINYYDSDYEEDKHYA